MVLIANAEIAFWENLLFPFRAESFDADAIRMEVDGN